MADISSVWNHTLVIWKYRLSLFSNFNAMFRSTSHFTSSWAPRLPSTEMSAMFKIGIRGPAYWALSNTIKCPTYCKRHYQINCFVWMLMCWWRVNQQSSILNLSGFSIDWEKQIRISITLAVGIIKIVKVRKIFSVYFRIFYKEFYIN